MGKKVILTIVLAAVVVGLAQWMEHKKQVGAMKMDMEYKYAVDSVTSAEGGKILFTFYGHASLAIEYDGQHVYIDPVNQFADYASEPKADVILITHHHDDHLDVNAVSDLSGEETRVIGTEAVSKVLARCEAMYNGDTLHLNDHMSVIAVPAYNTTPGHEGFHPHTGRDNGYLLTIGGTRIYVAGDSEPTPEMAALKEIDVAFLPVNQPFTMSEEQAAQVVNVMKPRLFYPYHYGMVEHQTDLNLLQELVSESGVEMRIMPME